MVDPGPAFYEQCGLYAKRSADGCSDFSVYDWRYRTWGRLLHLDRQGKLLDIGCGDGGFLHIARKRGFEVFGVDLDERAVERAGRIRGLPNVVCGPWEDAVKKAGWRDFEVVTMFDVLEHLSSPLTALSSAFDLVRAGGFLCVTVPRLDRFPRIFDIEADFPLTILLFGQTLPSLARSAGRAFRKSKSYVSLSN
jgi:2-polyprenyl-3-methyl-5-hydroxy-6-metoxy-1,4-benzoquinol methylase